MNQPTYAVNVFSSIARQGEVPNASWTTGMNNSGSNSPGIGIATDVPNLSEDPSQWTLLDQDGAARTPQSCMLIGGDGLGEGDRSTAAILVGTPSGTGDGSVTLDGSAQLVTLAAGWAAV